MLDGLLLALAGLAIGTSAGLGARYQRKHRGAERFHLGSWIAFALNFIVVVAASRAVNPIVQSDSLSAWWFVLAFSLAIGAFAAIGFHPLGRTQHNQTEHE
jgi:hypothetical protein